MICCCYSCTAVVADDCFYVVIVVAVVIVVGVGDDSPDVVAESEMASLSSVRFNCLLRSILQKLYNWKEKMKTISKRDETANNGFNIQRKYCLVFAKQAAEQERGGICFQLPFKKNTFI